MTEQMLEQIGFLALESMLFEVSATPKPGLVDRYNNGAHHDMDFFTFMSSEAALRHSFDDFAQLGYAHREEPVAQLLPYLQQSGQAAEKSMFAGTGGINTHKGMIFSLGLLSGAAGWLAGREILAAERLCLLVAQMCAGLSAQDEAALKRKPPAQLTKGEAMYLKYGVTGARGEAESGFKTVRAISLPLYCQLREKGCSVNNALVDCLLHLLAYAGDTNILGRHDMSTLKYAQREAAKVLEKGSIHTEEGRQAIIDLDNDFIEKYISPGGCADLIAVTHFLYEAEKLQ